MRSCLTHLVKVIFVNDADPNPDSNRALKADSASRDGATSHLTSLSHDRGVYGGALLHPLTLLCLALWALNDHYGKGVWPGWLSGKLSDVVSLIGSSILTGAALEIALGLRGTPLKRARELGLRASKWGALSAAIVMVGINIWPLWAEAYEVGLGAVQWSVVSAWRWFTDQPIPPLYRVTLTMDSGDLLTVPAALGGPWIYRRSMRE